MRVLVVDDNRHVRALVKQILGAVDVQVDEADSGLAALAYCKTAPPDLVIVDFEMPGMSGATFTHALRGRASGEARPIPVLLMTGHGDMRRIEEATAAGVNSVIAKPLSPQVLFQRIELALLDAAGKGARKVSCAIK